MSSVFLRFALFDLVCLMINNMLNLIEGCEMSVCKVCGLGLVPSEEDGGICLSCENIPEEQRVVSEKAKSLIAKSSNEKKPATKIKTYKGKKDEVAKAFEKNAVTMEKEGYFPISQSYEPGSWGCGAFIIAFLLCFILIGLIVFVYMMIVKPDGVLTVTYEYRGDAVDVESVANDAEKVCPQCAETVKAGANICRYCRYDFSGEAESV